MAKYLDERGDPATATHDADRETFSAEEAKQGRSGTAILAVLLGGLLLAFVVWGGVAIWGESTDSDRTTETEQVQPAPRPNKRVVSIKINPLRQYPRRRIGIRPPKPEPAETYSKLRPTVRRSDLQRRAPYQTRGAVDPEANCSAMARVAECGPLFYSSISAVEHS